MQSFAQPPGYLTVAPYRPVPGVVHSAEIAPNGWLQRNTARAANRSCVRSVAVWDNPVPVVLLQAFNTATTKNHGAARSGSNDTSPRAVLQQPGMEIEQQARAQAAHAEMGQDPGIMHRQDRGDSFDFNDQLPLHLTAPAAMMSGPKS